MLLESTNLLESELRKRRMSRHTAVIKVLCKLDQIAQTATLLAWALGRSIDVSISESNSPITWLFIPTDLAYNNDDEMILEHLGLDIVGKVAGVLGWEVVQSDRLGLEIHEMEDRLTLDIPQQNMENELISVLYSLPIAISIMRRASGKYAWKWLEASGQADTFIMALTSALTHVMKSYIAVRSEVIGS